MKKNQMSTLKSLTKLLGPDKVQDLILELSQNLDDDSKIDSLCDLLDQASSQTHEVVSQNVIQYMDQVLGSIHHQNSIETLVKLFAKLPEIYEIFINKVVVILKQYMSQNINKFILGIRPIIDASPILNVQGQSYDLEYITYILEKVEFVFSKINLLLEGSEIDQVLAYLMAFDIDEIYGSTLKIFRWRISPITEKTLAKTSDLDSNFLWDIIFSLVRSNRSHQTNAYILWLRYLNNAHSNFQDDSFYQTQILNLNYFQTLQDGLISDSHEHRKLCLSILKLSILKINKDINTEIFKWRSAEREEYMKEWERFITVFEIIAIDTSLHQMEAAAGDLIGLISPSSLIHSSWGFRLLSTGFRAGSDSVRKFSLYLLLSIPGTSLNEMQKALPILENIFLPNLMIANHFVVNNDKCEYGDKLSEFICDLIKSSKNDHEINIIVESILNVMVNSKDSFDPCKCYVLFGIHKGVQNEDLAPSNCTKLISLFECRSEGFLYHTTIQTTLLNIVLKLRYDETQFLRIIDKFIKFNGSKLINENLKVIKEYLLRNKAILEPINGDEDPFINAIASYLYGLINGNMNFPQNTILFANLLGTGLDLSKYTKEEWYSSNLQLLLGTDLSFDQWEILSNSPEISGTTDSSKLWTQIQLDVKSDNDNIIKTSVFKYKVFNKILNNLNPEETGRLIDINQCKEFKKSIFINANETVPNFYKIKESMLGEYFKTIEILNRLHVLKVTEIPDFIKDIPSSLSNHQSNISITQFFRYSIERGVSDEVVVEMIHILLDIWHSLESARFKLHQKDIQIAIIECAMSIRVLQIASTNDSLSSRLSKFCLSVIDNSPGRRCLLPTLTKQISLFQVSSNEHFEKSFWLNNVLVRAYLLYQLRTNGFKLEPIVGQVFDTTFGQSDTSIYLKVYDTLEISAQVYMMAIFNSIKTPEFAKSLLEYILDNEKSFNLFKCIKPNDGYEQWTRIRLFTIITCLCDKLDDDTIKAQLPLFNQLLQTDPSPLVRVYIEWIIALQLKKFPDYRQQVFESLTASIHDKNSKPTVVCAYQRLLTLSAKELPKSEAESLLTSLLRILVPGATANKSLIRHFSNSLICSIYPQIAENNYEISPDLLSVCGDIYKTSMQTPIHEIRNGDALLWNIAQDLNLVSLSGGLLMRVSVHEVDFISSKDYHRFLDQSQVHFLNHSIGEDLSESWGKRKGSNKKEPLTIFNPEHTPLQTKSGAWSSVMDIDSNRVKEIKRSELIIVSSLVDKPPNLGGICRLCDVLGAGLLTVHDIQVKNHPEFKNVAVTADRWMPMVEVQVDGIIEYLRLKKREGYTLIGLEQTDKSVELNNDLKFPKKSLILIGKEREGVPGELLAELDFCVEIKQVGVVRSMNIQTATAVIVHSYACQHC